MLILFSLFVSPNIQSGENKTQASPTRIEAPEFPEGMEWMNTGGRPIRLADLRGKLVLLDFWTYCCINCMHIIPDLKKLEAKYPNNLVVIGVHSAKFTNEGLTENIRQAILRYEIEHPVVNDNEMRIWSAYGIYAWPTQVLIDPEGFIVAGYTGEGNYEEIDKQIGGYVNWFRQQGKKLDETPFVTVLEKLRLGPGLLSFPGKVVADPARDRLFIADSGHNRIIITRRNGELLDVAGRGKAGQGDGPFESASFFHPQGMAVDGDALYVADTDNHLIRRLDLKSRTVTTIAGTGKQGGFLNMGGLGTRAPLSSPWDLELVGNKLYIAMAGVHQIWVMDLGNSLVQPYAGSGREGIRDGPLDGSEWAQPSGITSDGKKLYVADSETSSIREIDMAKKWVRTIVGRGLFIFGDRDGRGSEVKLQHPLGILYHDGLVYVADTYNHKIKVINPAENTSKTFLGSGRAGYRDGSGGEFYEPGGLDFTDGRFFIADTNNHVIRVADLAGNVTTLELKGLRPLTKAATALLPGARELKLPVKRLKSESKGQLIINLTLPEGYHLNPMAPLLYKAEVSGEIRLVGSDGLTQIDNPELPITLAFTTGKAAGRASIRVSLTFYYCRTDNQGVCLAESVVLEQPLEVSPQGGDTRIMLHYRVEGLARRDGTTEG